METLELNHTYLISQSKSYSHNVIRSITILLITESTYYICWNNSDNKQYSWELKNFMETDDYKIIEDITKFVKHILYPIKSSFSTTIEKCIFCNGKGNIIDNKSTAGQIPCNICNGTGNIMKEIKI